MERILNFRLIFLAFIFGCICYCVSVNAESFKEGSRTKSSYVGSQSLPGIYVIEDITINGIVVNHKFFSFKSVKLLCRKLKKKEKVFFLKRGKQIVIICPIGGVE